MSQIVIDARELRTTTGRYIERLIHNLQEIDKHNKYLILLKQEDIDSWNPTNSNFEKLASNYKEFTFAEQLGLNRQLNSIAPDLVHFGMVQQPILYKGKVVTTMHDLTTTRFTNPAKNKIIFKIKQVVYRWVNRVAARKSNAIITPSEFVKDDVAKYARVNSRKIAVTYEAADKIKEDSVPIKDLVGTKFIVYVGRPQPHKNLYRLATAFADLKQSQPNLKLVLAGKKDILFKQLETWVNDNSIKNVVFTDYVSEGELRWLYENCRAYVFPSLSEGFGLPGLEAMCHGAAVVSSNATCLPEIYGSAAHYFDPNDIEDMSTKINEVISSKNLREELIRKGHNQVKKYSWRKMAEETLEVYNKVLDEN